MDHERYDVNLHRWKPEPHLALGHKRITTPNLAADFHVWGCEFTARRINYYFDGKLVRSVDATAIPHGPQNIWLTSIAAPLGGTKAVDDSELSGAAEFDYVRYFAPIDQHQDGKHGWPRSRCIAMGRTWARREDRRCNR